MKENMMRMTILTLCLTGLALSATAAPYVITLEGKQIDGTAIRANRNGDIILTTSVGNQTFPKGRYLKAFADKPREMDEATRLIQAKQYSEAAALLEKVVRDYSFLGWDNQAQMLLPRCYASAGSFEKAVEAFEDLFRNCDECKKNVELKWQYMEMLLGAKKFDKMDDQLNDIIANGERADAARAQIMRGDMGVARGDLEDAVLDYMRTVVLFKAQKEQQPEALYKTAETLEKLLDGRAKNFYQQVVDDYPSSPYAAEARKKL